MMMMIMIHKLFITVKKKNGLYAIQGHCLMVNEHNNEQSIDKE